MVRAQTEETLQEFGAELSKILPGSEVEILEPGAVLPLFRRLSARCDGIPRAAWDEAEGRVVGFIFDGGDEPCAALTLTPLREPDEYDLQFTKGYARVFNSDLALAPLVKQHSELWRTLQADRFPRAMARDSAFHTESYHRALQKFEAAAQLKYEGAVFNACVFLTKQIEWIREAPGVSFIPFAEPLAFEAAMLEEKWVRSLADGAQVGLVGLGHGHGVVGLVTIPDGGPDGVEAPHESLAGVVALVRGGVNAFACAPNGDIYVVHRAGYAFLKSQGKWRYQNYRGLRLLLCDHLPEDVVDPILRLALDLSFTRRGALFCVPDDAQRIRAMVPDHGARGKPNETLRLAARHLTVHDRGHCTILRSIATVDGAVILSRLGRVLDAACMITDPSPEALSQIGVGGIRRFAGARTTAAWNASVYGLAIKVSEDGPIHVYRRCERVGELA